MSTDRLDELAVRADKLAVRVERIADLGAQTEQRRNALIGVVDGIVRRQQ